MNKAQFVRTRPLSESSEQVKAAAQKAGVRGMTTQDIYMARKPLRNRQALLEAREAIGAPPLVDAEEQATTEPGELPRRRRRRLVPAAGTVAHRVHLWLTHYVHEHGRGPPNAAAVAGALGMPDTHCSNYVNMLRKTKVIDYEYRDLRTMRILRSPAKEIRSNGTTQNGVHLEPTEKTQDEVHAEIVHVVSSGNAWQPPLYLAQLEWDLSYVLGKLALDDSEANVQGKANAAREVLAMTLHT